MRQSKQEENRRWRERNPDAKCPRCGNQLPNRFVDYCGDCPKPLPEWSETARRLYVEDKQGCKAIGKALDVGHIRVMQCLKKMGVYPGNIRQDFLSRRRAQGHQSWALESAQIEQRLFLKGDEQTHWGNHTEVGLYMGFKRYWSMSADQRNKRSKANTLQKKAKPDFRLKFNTWRNKRMDTCPAFKLRTLLSSRLGVAMSGGKAGASLTAFTGCSMEFLRAHIERQFERGMTWSNHGPVWHVDHILPVSLFDHAIDSEVKKAWNWQNLRPLAASHNLAKGSKITDHQQRLVLTV